MDGAAFAKENGCDFVVALGGGSVMDASKAMAAMATNDGDIWDYQSGGTGGYDFFVSCILYCGPGADGFRASEIHSLSGV